MIAHSPPIVSSDQSILGGILVFSGTRVPVESLLAHLKAGDTIETFLNDFPSVAKSQVEAYLDLTAELAVENAASADPSR